MSFFRRLAVNADYRKGFMDWTCIMAGTGIFIGYISLNTALIQYVKQFSHFYKDGRPVKLDNHVSMLAAIALNDAKIGRNEKPLVQFYPVYGDEPFHCGSTLFVKGAIVGIPYNFIFREKSDIVPSEISVFNQNNIPWDSKAGQMLLDGLVLSDSAKKFAILREIYAAATFQPIWSACIGCGGIIVGRKLATLLAEFFKPRYNSFPLPARVAAQLFLAFFSYASYCRARDICNGYYEKRSDREAILTLTAEQAQSSTEADGTTKVSKNKVSDQYFDGAIEYYTKLMSKNKAYRRLLGKDGPKYFTRDGDEQWTLLNWLFKPSPVPLTERMRHLQATVDYHQADADPAA